MVIGTLVVAAATALIVLEGTPEVEVFETRQVDRATGGGFAVIPPQGYLQILDPRARLPGGAVALGRETRGGRATIVVAGAAEQLPAITQASCAAYLERQRRSLGVQLRGQASVVRDDGQPRCAAELREGPDIAGVLRVAVVGGRTVQWTCRFPIGSERDRRACAGLRVEAAGQ